MSKRISIAPLLRKAITDSSKKSRRSGYNRLYKPKYRMYKGRLNYDHLTATNSEVNTGGTITSLTGGITQGVGAGSRVDDTVDIKRIYGRLMFTTESGAAANTIHFTRIIIFKWLVDSAVDSPALADILEDTAVNPYQSGFVLPPQERRKFKVLMDKLYYTSNRETSPGSTKLLKINIPRCGKVRYNEAATTGYGQVYILTLGNSATASGDCTRLYYNLSIKYRDV